MASSGGFNAADFYRIKVDSTTTPTKWEVLDVLTDTVATGVGAPNTAHKAFALRGVIESTKPAFQEDGTVTVDFDQIEAETIWDFLNKEAVPAVGESTLPEKVLEDGVKEGGTGTSGTGVLMISYGWLDAAKAKRFVLVAYGKISPTSGSYETKGEDYTMPAFQFTGKKLEFVDFTIPVALFDTAILNSTAAGTAFPEIKKGSCYLRKFVTKAA